jgi:hypothetical protein
MAMEQNGLRRPAHLDRDGLPAVSVFDRIRRVSESDVVGVLQYNGRH